MISYLLAGPAEEPVSLAEAKAFLRVDADDDDGLVLTLIAAARLHVESVTGRALVSQSWRLVLDCWPEDRVVTLPVSPLVSLTSITAFDEDGDDHLVPLAQFEAPTAVTPARLILPRTVDGMPVLREGFGIEVDYVAGFGAAIDVPSDLKRGVLALVAHWFEHRDAVLVAGSGAVIPPGFGQMISPLSTGAAVNAPVIGALTDRVSLQRRVDTSELEGGVIHMFMTVSSVWARVRSLSARLAMAGDGRTAEASHSVVVRFRSDVSVGDRFGWRGRWLEVVGFSDLDGRRAWLSCQCQERGMAG